MTPDTEKQMCNTKGESNSLDLFTGPLTWISWGAQLIYVVFSGNSLSIFLKVDN